MPRYSLSMSDLRRRCYELLEQGPIGDRSMRIVSRLLILLIIVNLIAVTMESIPNLQAQYAVWFSAIEWVSLIAFTVEYIVRIWVAVEHAPYRHLPARVARLRFARSAEGVIDLLAVLPFWFAFLIPADLRFVLVLRIVRFLKLARYSPAVRSLIEALYAERRALFGCVVILLGTTMIAGSLMYLAERHVQPDKLGTIPDAMGGRS